MAEVAWLLVVWRRQEGAATCGGSVHDYGECWVPLVTSKDYKDTLTALVPSLCRATAPRLVCALTIMALARKPVLAGCSTALSAAAASWPLNGSLCVEC